MRRAFAACIVVACASSVACAGLIDLGPTPVTFEDDASTPDAAAPDAAPDADPPEDPLPVNDECDPNLPFGEPVRVDALNSTRDDYDARLAPNELTVWLATNRDHPGTTYLSIYVATRARKSDPFGAPEAVAELTGSVFAPSVTSDGTLYFNGVDRDMDIWKATRDASTGKLGHVTPIVGANTARRDANPIVTPDGASLYFYSDREGDNRLYVASSIGFGQFGAPKRIPVLDEGEAHNVAVTADQLTIAFASTRGGTTKGGDEIWISHRRTTSDRWRPPRLLAELNTPHNEAATWISANGRRIYIQSDRDGAYEIYTAIRPK